MLFLNQARASLWLVHTWFLIVVSVREHLYVCVFACVCACVCVHLRVSAPEAINNQWHDVV